jgi:hypothetical protein
MTVDRWERTKQILEDALRILSDTIAPSHRQDSLRPLLLQRGELLVLQRYR